MIDKKDFENIRKQMEDFEAKREETIQNSRQTITLSKQIIYSIHRNDFENASKLLKEIKLKIKGLDKKSVLLPVFIKSIDQERLIKKIGVIPKIKLQEVEEAIKIVLDLKKETYLN